MTRENTESLAAILTRSALRQEAGGRSFGRGEEYYAEGRVKSLAVTVGVLKAVVKGNRAYQVRLKAVAGRLEGDCSCPVGQDGDFCKHCVAVGLAWLGSGAKPEANLKDGGRGATVGDLRSYLAGLEKSELVDLVMGKTQDDDRWRRSLTLRAAGKGGGRADLDVYKNALDEALDADDFIGWDEVFDYATGVEDAVSSIAGLLKKGRADEVIELCEYAIAGVERAMENVDDSDGSMGTILAQIQETHLRACRKARPDPEALARRLFKMEMETEYCSFSGAAQTYRAVLGKKGLESYRRLAEAEWAKVAPLGPGQKDKDAYGGRYRITQIMETLATLTGDVESLVDVMKRDLSSVSRFLGIAEIYKEARRKDAALEWAEKAIRAFPEAMDSSLSEFLAVEYEARGRFDEAMDLMWKEFVDDPGLVGYQDLKRHAQKAGGWPIWREKALEILRHPQDEWRRRQDRSELVWVYLWEKDDKNAWKVAKEGGCSLDLWLRLAVAREKAHPEDALEAYRRLIDPTLYLKNNESYRQTVERLGKIRTLLSRLGRDADFAPYVASVREAHKPKRNFLKLLDQARWG
jgi:tetratricopeptide (TPR) repeat protein